MTFSKYINENTTTPAQLKELNEAKFSNNNLQKVSELLVSLARKKLQKDFYFAWADDFKKSSGKSGIGYRYMTTTGEQIRFNHVKNSNSFAVNSVDYWKKGDTLTEPSISVYFSEGINIVQLTDKLWESLKAGRVLPIKVKDIIKESELDELNEKMTDEQRQQFVQHYGIPASYARSDKALSAKAEKVGLETELNEWASMKMNDSEKTKFSDNTYTSQQKLNDKTFYADPKYVFDDMVNAAEVIAKGLWRSMIVAGMGGIGKCVHGSTELDIRGLE